MSRHHARILYFDGKASLQDLGSHNGCWVNGTPTSTCALAEGDVIRIGNFKITFRVGMEESDDFSITFRFRDVCEGEMVNEDNPDEYETCGNVIEVVKYATIQGHIDVEQEESD